MLHRHIRMHCLSIHGETTRLYISPYGPGTMKEVQRNAGGTWEKTLRPSDDWWVAGRAAYLSWRDSRQPAVQGITCGRRMFSCCSSWWNRTPASRGVLAFNSYLLQRAGWNIARTAELLAELVAERTKQIYSYIVLNDCVHTGSGAGSRQERSGEHKSVCVLVASDAYSEQKDGLRIANSRSF
jgi:hypothetical protein